MGKALLVLFVLVIVVLVGGSIYLLTWDAPPPAAQVEKVIPNERFQR